MLKNLLIEVVVHNNTNAGIVVALDMLSELGVSFTYYPMITVFLIESNNPEIVSNEIKVYLKHLGATFSYIDNQDNIRPTDTYKLFCSD